MDKNKVRPRPQKYRYSFLRNDGKFFTKVFKFREEVLKRRFAYEKVERYLINFLGEKHLTYCFIAWETYIKGGYTLLIDESGDNSKIRLATLAIKEINNKEFKSFRLNNGILTLTKE